MKALVADDGIYGSASFEGDTYRHISRKVHYICEISYSQAYVTLLILSDD
jgi:hypothetical protein